ncbi:ABC transporter permease [Actinocrinis puniceicyclus]|uniref:Transport permease protein n=1 Tax=Actinocrinis puniceicyclus TaxID=977794 RepID=A0A8J7WPS1_9ACTN|nr:ABC transporter permease [Actinocrinis puniceicyclus]MBS2964107.1 ABC transporter permease [Actinocrinis puniceicyclus]
MSSLTYAVADSATMLRRTLRHVLRYPAMLAASLGVPVILLLLFVGILGRTLGAGLNDGHAAGATHTGGYIDYVAPGIILMAVSSGCMATSVAVCVDLTEGIINRFRTMAISRAALLTGHVLASVIQTSVATALVIGVAVAMGWRPTGGPLAWLAAIGLLELLSFALTWLAVAIGLVSKTPESSSNTPMLIQFLPFLGSAFVPAASMPAGVRWFAEYQPFTPVNETLRGLLTGTAIGDNAWIALAWCLGILALGYWWARTVFRRGRLR